MQHDADTNYIMSLKNIRLLCTDFDGTLYSETMSPRIPSGLIDCIGSMQQNGTLWMINTGRDREFLLESLLEHNEGLLPDYIGVVEREVYTLQSNAYHPVHDWNSHSKSIHTALFKKYSSLMLEVSEWINGEFDAHVYEDKHSPVCLIARCNEDADLIHRFVDEKLRAHTDLAWVRNDIYARFSHASIHKGTLVGEIAKRHQISRDQILVAGDHFNDIPMLHPNVAQHLIAPGNSIPAVMEHVMRHEGKIASQPAGDGVLECLRQFDEGAW